MNAYRTSEQKPGRGRFAVFAVLLAAAALALLARYGYLMLGPRIFRASSSRSQLSGRGPILDRNGRILAMETRLGNISVWRPDIRSRDESPAETRKRLAEKLAPILDIPAEEILLRINDSPSDFLYLKKQADESTLNMIEKIQREERLPGLGIEAVMGRIYPEGRLASQIIGFVGDENSGLGGIEYAFEKDLTAESQGEGERGSKVYLTIDANVQHILENLAGKVLRENRAEAVMFMALDPRTGDILGSASLPNFDPNNIRASTEMERMNRPASWAYEPGSVFKIFSLSALLDSGAVTGNSHFFCNGRYEHITGRGEIIIINCLEAHGSVTPREIMIYSCNAGAGYASDRLERSPFYDELKGFGFGVRTATGSPGETAGFFPPVERWSERSKPTIAMGQEIAVSAVQMLQAASAVANDGLLVPPRVVLKTVSADGKTVKEFRGGEPRRVMRPETAQAMRDYMKDVTGIGTGTRANLPDLSLAVKTGTAQIIDPNTTPRTYSSTDFIASCLALLPAESPSLVLYLVIVKPRGEYLGGRIAAPPIREAADALINYLGIPRDRNPQISHSGDIPIPQVPLVEVNSVVPDFRGLSKRSLVPLLYRDDLHLEISGEGWVARQSPAPGTPLRPDTVIRLELE